MAEMWKPQSIEVYKKWLDAIIDEARDKLNSWENDFIVSIGTRLYSGINLTQNQAEKLEAIYASKTG